MHGGPGPMGPAVQAPSFRSFLLWPCAGPCGSLGKTFCSKKGRVNATYSIGRVNAPLNAGLWVADGPRHHTPVKGNWRSVAGNTGAPNIHDAAIANFATSPLAEMVTQCSLPLGKTKVNSRSL